MRGESENRRLRIEASLLNAPLGNLEKLCLNLEQAGIDALHLDVMDGHFVENLSFGPSFVEQVRIFCQLPIHVHLMTFCPQKYFFSFIQAGVNSLSFHYEAVLEDGSRIIDSLKGQNIEIGIAISPETNIEVLSPLLSQVDRVLLMSVPPGFGGQKFIPSILTKICFLSKFSKNLRIQVDGGLQEETSQICLEKGANELTIGSALFDKKIVLSSFLSLLRGYKFR